MESGGIDRGNQSRLPSTLLGLLSVVAILWIGLGFIAWNRSRGAVTTAFLEVQSAQNPHAVLALLSSPLVVEDVLQSPGISQLASVSRQSEPAVWLTKRLKTSYAASSPIVELQIQGPASGSQDDQRLLDAVIKSFRNRMTGQNVEVKVIQQPMTTVR